MNNERGEKYVDELEKLAMIEANSEKGKFAHRAYQIAFNFGRLLDQYEQQTKLVESLRNEIHLLKREVDGQNAAIQRMKNKEVSHD